MRLLVFGIDGGTWKILAPLMRRGELPNLTRLATQGVRAVLRSTLPPQSAPAWVSLITGQNPGRHGIFDFWTRDLSQYEDSSPYLNQSDRFAGRALWDYVGAAGLPVGVVSVPVTYPAWPVNGFLLSGTLLAPGMNEQAAYPPDLAAKYGLSLNFPDGYRFGASREAVMAQGPAMMRRRGEIVLELLATHPCEFLMVVFGETDKVQHDFWRYTEDACQPAARGTYGDAINEHYRVADSVLGRILDAVGGDPLVAVVSDHGAGPYARRAFHTNAWLREQGFLECRDARVSRTVRVGHAIRQLRRFMPDWLYAGVRERLRLRPLQAVHSLYTEVHYIDWQSTLAYRVPMELPAEGIVVNRQGRQPKGVVPGHQYDDVLAAISKRLRNVMDPETGLPVIAEIHRRDDVYTGPYADKYAPDLVLVMADGYKADWGNSLPVLASVSSDDLAHYRGAHTMDGVLMLGGPCFASGQDLGQVSILDVGPTLLHALGLPVPSNMDGRVLVEAFEPGSMSEVRYAVLDEAPGTADLQDTRLSAQEQDEIIDRLRGLGYVE